MPLIYYPNKVLTTPARLIEPNEFSSLPDLVNEMSTIIFDQQGLGLAAPQVGQSIQLFLIRTIKDDIIPFINPIFTELSNETVQTLEGCLSLPTVEATLQRRVWVEVLAQDIDGKLFRTKLIQRDAIIAQHENDHLEGRTLFESMSKSQRVFKRNSYLKKVKRQGKK